MESNSKPQAVWPSLRCRDARELIKFLTEAFGFEETLVVEDAGTVHHGELRWPVGGGVMLGDRRDTDDNLHAQLPDAPHRCT